MPGIDAGAAELVGDDRPAPCTSSGGAEAAVLLRDGAGEVAVLEQQRLPVQRLAVGPLAAAARPRRAAAVLGDEAVHLVAQRAVLFRQRQIHGHLPQA